MSNVLNRINVIPQGGYLIADVCLHGYLFLYIYPFNYLHVYLPIELFVDQSVCVCVIVFYLPVSLITYLNFWNFLMFVLAGYKTTDGWLLR